MARERRSITTEPGSLDGESSFEALETCEPPRGLPYSCREAVSSPDWIFIVISVTLTRLPRTWQMITVVSARTYQARNIVWTKTALSLMRLKIPDPSPSPSKPRIRF